MKRKIYVIVLLAAIFGVFNSCGTNSTGNGAIEETPMSPAELRKLAIEAMDTNANYFDSIKAIYNYNYEVTQIHYNTAFEINNLVEDIVTFAEVIQAELIDKGGGKDENGVLKYKDNDKIVTPIMLGEGRGTVLQEQIIAHRDKMFGLGIWSAQDVNELTIFLPLNADFDDEMQEAARLAGNNTWAEYLFDKVTLEKGLNILDSISDDARLSGDMMMERLYRKAQLTVKNNKSR